MILLGLLAVAACDRRPDDVPVLVSVIGGPVTRTGGKGDATEAGRLARASTAQGLVRFDANGGIEPGLAERWIVIDDGLSFIFRLRDAEWADGRAVTAEEVIPLLRRAIANPRSALRPYLSAIDEVVAMTPQVIEVRLTRPRPDLLKLFAQPELTIAGPRGGTGPFRIQRADGHPGMILRPAFDPERSPDEQPEEPAPEDFVRLRGERAAAAILRFAARRSDLVTGGMLADWPMVALAEVPRANIRFDAANGLLGLRVATRAGFLADPQNRAAVAMAVDRQAIAAAFGSGWAATETLLPERLDTAGEPASAAWSAIATNDRAAAAAARVAQWQADHPGPVALRIALPEGPGGTLLWTALAGGLRQAGFSPERVAPRAAADLRLVDQVAPYDSARWYLRTACQPCNADVAGMIVAARDAPDLPTRALFLSRADSALAADIAFIPIARPFRWSLVAQRLRAWTPNARAFHPLNHLRTDPN